LKSSTSKTAAKIRTLAQIAEELRGGAVFSITRLTTIKSLCEDPEAAAQFGVHLAVLTQAKMSRRDCPDHLAAYWGYRVAKEYAERYEPRYGTGLIPESAPLVQEIAEFWCRYHFEKPLNEWLGASAS
jgi:hypothetical protein